MRMLENDCVGCETCVNCGRGDYTAYCCDECGNEDTLYDFDGYEICADCLLSRFNKVEGSY